MKNKNIILIIVLLIIVIGLIVFFMLKGNTEDTENTFTNGNISFTPGNEIILSLNQEKSVANGYVTFVSDINTTSVTCYNVSLNIISNNLKSYLESDSIKLLLSVGKNGYVLLNDIDITDSIDDIKIPISKDDLTNYNHTISLRSKDSHIDNYAVSVRIEGLDESIEKNDDVLFNGKIVFSKCGE